MKKLSSLKWLNDRLEKCACKPAFLSDSKKIKAPINRLIQKTGLTIVGYATHQFDQGYTSVWLLKQSHLSLHSWPEYNFVTLSLEVCNFDKDDASKIDQLYAGILDFFKPKRSRPKKLTTRLGVS